jgi:hypothetical protein
MVLEENKIRTFWKTGPNFAFSPVRLSRGEAPDCPPRKGGKKPKSGVFYRVADARIGVFSAFIYYVTKKFEHYD